MMRREGGVGSMVGMDGLMDAVGPIGLVILALVDSTSVGTLVVPVMLLVVGGGGARRVAGRTVFYLLVIGAFYLALGIVLMAGLLPVFGHVQGVLTSPAGTILLVAAGVLLVVWSYRVDPKTIEKRGGDPEAGAKRWSERVQRAAGSLPALVALALTAGVIEAASMVPYLVAMGLIADMGAGLGQGALILVGYCAVMILPGLVLAGIRLLMGARGDAVLDRVHGWAVKNATGAFAWAIGIVGVIVLVNSVPQALEALRIPGVSVG